MDRLQSVLARNPDRNTVPIVTSALPSASKRAILQMDVPNMAKDAVLPLCLMPAVHRCSLRVVDRHHAPEVPSCPYEGLETIVDRLRICLAGYNVGNEDFLGILPLNHLPCSEREWH